MSGRSQNTTFTTEFGHEFEAERGEWLHRRFLWYTGVLSTMYLVLALIGALNITARGLGSVSVEAQMNAAVSAVSLALFGAGFVQEWRRRGTKESLLRIAVWLLVINGLIRLAVAPLMAEYFTAHPTTGASQTLSAAGLVAVGALFSVTAMHFVACLFLPWTARESYRPLVPLIAAFAVIECIYIRQNPVTGAIAIALSPLMGVPGAAICWWRNSRFRDRFTLQVLRGRYAEIKAELTSARTIHESLFPKPVKDGPVRFSYVYEPMRQIGGDYLYACFTPGAGGERALNVALIDVTGHGIPAALTVNRLHGELERIFAEHPDFGPGEVLSLLNRYVHLTLATHSVYVTALCFRADPAKGTLEYASGGHPPAFLRAVDGTIDQLDSTAFVLGACAGSDFRSEPRTLRFMPGDCLIAYTDGATEARDNRGKFLGVAGIQRLVAEPGAPAESWPAAILRAVEQHRQGPAADDTLVIEIVRPLGEHPRTGVLRSGPVRAEAALSRD